MKILLKSVSPRHSDALGRNSAKHYCRSLNDRVNRSRFLFRNFAIINVAHKVGSLLGKLSREVCYDFYF